MTMVYGSVCSGIEAASIAWHVMGWRPAFFSEIEPFPRAVLAHHYPEVPLHGDFTTIQRGDYADIDVLVGGTPCQSFSVAGLRGGLDDDRGNLSLEFCRLARRLGPKWILWENVPGVLSMDGGRAFASILGGLADCGYGLAYRVLDAQFVRVDGFGRAVPQRRRRVFVVGCLGDWRRAAAVLFERQSLCGDTPPRREAGQNTAPTFSASARGGGGRLAEGEHELGTDAELDGALLPLNAIDGASHALAASRGGSKALDATMETYVASTREAAATLTRGAESAGKGGYAGRRQEDDDNIVALCLNAKGGGGRLDAESETLIPCTPAGGGFDDVAHALRADGFDASEDGTGRGTPLVPVAPTLRAGGNKSGGDRPPGTDVDTSELLIPVAQGVALRGREDGATAELTGAVATALRCGGGGGDKPHVLAFNARHDPDVFDGYSGPLDTDGSTQAVMTAADGVSTARLPCGQPKGQQEWRVRRLMPVECERLQGFPDGYTMIPGAAKGGWRDVDETEDIEDLRAMGLELRARGNAWRVKDPDGPRYKALGNSMAVNVMRWIGRRIEIVEAIP